MNSQAEKIQSALEGAVNAYLLQDESYDLDISALDLRIIIKGPRWSGVVDKPLAKFLLDFDKKISDELQKHGVVLPEGAHGFIAIQVTEGSADMLLKLAKDMVNSLKKMSTKDKVIILVAMLAALGIYTSPNIIKEINAPKAEQIRSQERVELVSAVTSIAKDAHDLQQPVRSLIKKIGENDTIKLPAVEEPLTKADAKMHLERRKRVVPEVYYIDQRYIVDGLSTKKADGWEVTLRIGDTSFSAKLMLTHEDASALLEDFQRAHAEGGDIAPDLQVSARINDKGIQSAEVVGLGEPREKAVRLSEALAKAQDAVAAAEQPTDVDQP